jgi:hypothetical protein
MASPVANGLTPPLLLLLLLLSFPDSEDEESPPSAFSFASEFLDADSVPAVLSLPLLVLDVVVVVVVVSVSVSDDEDRLENMTLPNATTLTNIVTKRTTEAYPVTFELFLRNVAFVILAMVLLHFSEQLHIQVVVNVVVKRRNEQTRSDRSR